MKLLAWTYMHRHQGPWYVANLPGDGGKDWGYTLAEGRAIGLTGPQWERFARDMRALGRAGFCAPKASPDPQPWPAIDWTGQYGTV